MTPFYRLIGFIALTQTASASAIGGSHECEAFFEHSSIIAKAAGTLDPRKVTGYSPLVCKQVFGTFQEKAPKAIGHVENLARHLQDASVRSSKDIAAGDVVHDVRKLADCDVFEFGQANPGPGSTTDAIELCQDIDTDICPHDPCVPEYLQTGNSESDNIYEEFPPDYPAGSQYDAFTTTLANPVGFDDIWTGCNRDRTKAGTVGSLLITIIAGTNALLIADVLCQAAGDDVELVIPLTPIAIDLPNPGRVVCAAIVGVAKAALLGINTLYEQVAYQDGLVDGAEIEAAYEHSRNLLTKQCAIFDQAVCRCAEEPLGYGHGCDGIDSNCNDLIDECDEDVVPPEIIVQDSVGLCGSSDIWFETNEDAQKCVEATVGVFDDCQTVTYDVAYTEGTCSATIIGINAQDSCTQTSSASVTVQVDGTKPMVECGFGGKNDPNVDVSFTGSGVLQNTELYYSATDNCGLPLNVTVDVYANEIEDFNAQEMALFYQMEGQDNGIVGLFVATGICSTESNGQCIKDDNAYDARRYTTVVSATDVAGNFASKECTYTILPKGNLKNKDVDFADSTQRFLLTSHTSIFD